MNEDAALIEQTLSGDTAAFGQLVRKYQDRLFNTLVHVTGCREEAEDVAQEAFVQAFLKLSSFQGKSGVYTWIYRIAFNMWISHRRRKRPEVSVEHVRQTSGEEPVDQCEQPTDQLERDERTVQIRQAINELHEDHRTILVLREMEGNCYETISEILDLPVGTVRSRLHRARMQLKRRLRELLKEPT